MIKTLIVATALIHVDETTSTVAGAKCWLHVACSEHLTAYFRHDCRGRAAVTAFGALPDYASTVAHDALSDYDGYPGATHSLCGAGDAINGKPWTPDFAT